MKLNILDFFNQTLAWRHQPRRWKYDAKMNSCINESNATFHAILSAYLSIIAGIIEAVLAVLSGREEISMSLYGIALVAVVDVTGSLLVLKMWQCRSSSGERLLPERLMEMNYSIVIGVLMTVLGTFLIADRYLVLSHECHCTL